MISEKYLKTKKSHKKQKVDETSRIIHLTNDDYNIISDRMEEFSNETCKNSYERNIDLVEGLHTYCRLSVL